MNYVFFSSIHIVLCVYVDITQLYMAPLISLLTLHGNVLVHCAG